MVRPYARLFRRYPKLPPAFSEPLETLDPDERIPIIPMLEGLRAAVEITNDPDLGLKAAHEIELGDYGAIEFMVNSAPDLRSAIELLGRYLPLINDALEFKLRVAGDLAEVQLDSSVVLPRAAADFQSAAFYLATLRRGEHMVDPNYQAWFTHARPQDVAEYERTFAPGGLRFDAPWCGFVFDARRLQQPLASADPQLHAVLRKYADLLLSELPKAESLTERVSALIAERLARGEPSAEGIARTLHMSRRTLTRKLEREGTSFKALLEDTRRRLALRYVANRELGLTEIAFLLGFSQTAPFHRAFKRWTGQTPLEYRRGGLLR